MPKTVNFNPTSDYELESANIERRRKMAEALAVEAGRFPDQTQMVSGVAVKQSPLIGAAKLAQALMAHKSLKEADEKQMALAKRMQEDRMGTLTDFQNLMQGQPGSYEQLPPGVFGPEQELQAPTPANPQAAMMRLMQSGDPMLQQAGMQNVMSQLAPQKPVVVGRSLVDPRTNKVVAVDETWKGEQEASRQEKAAQAQAQRQQRMEELQMRLEDQRISRQEQMALRREMAGIAHADRMAIAEMANARRDQKNVPKLPTSALKMQQEELDAIGTSSTINADLASFEKQIDSGQLKLGPMNNLTAKAKNLAGVSDEQSRNFASFQSTLEKLRNDSLRLNKGVQTEGDAQRAWNELVANINDPKVVKQRLGEIKRINERAANLRRMNVDAIRSNFGVDPMDTSGYQNQPAAVGNPGGSNIDALLKKYGG